MKIVFVVKLFKHIKIKLDYIDKVPIGENGFSKFDHKLEKNIHKFLFSQTYLMCKIYILNK